jgi:alpha-ketoglutarate-dependent taurine dioxygenase
MLFEALSPAIGARVTGIDLCAGIDDAARDALLQGLHTHHVLFFEDQPLTPAQHRDLAAHFGKLHIHPVYPTVPEVPEIIVLDTGHHNPPDSDTWHTDVTFIETPPMGALLSARVLPTGTLRRTAGGAPAELPGYADGAWWVQDAAATLPARRRKAPTHPLWQAPPIPNL